MANSNPVKETPAEKAPEVVEKTAKAPKEAGNPLDKFKTELPNGLTIHNFTA